jgi:catechol-2,3-dioxygenase
MIRVKKIAHAVYEMPDVDKQSEYYTEVIGLALTDKRTWLRSRTRREP